MEPFPEHRGYQIHHFFHNRPWTASGKDGTVWFEADGEAELRGMIDAALDEIPASVA